MVAGYLLLLTLSVDQRVAILGFDVGKSVGLDDALDLLVGERYIQELGHVPHSSGQVLWCETKS